MILFSSPGGFLGRLVAQRLVLFNHPVALLAPNPRPEVGEAEAEVPFVQGVEIRDADVHLQRGLRRMLGDVKVLLVMGRGHRVDEEYESVLLEAASAVGINHVVRLSMVRASVDAESAVLRRHGRANEALRQSGLRHTILSPHLYHQDLLEFAADVRAGTDILDPTNGAGVPYVDVRDVADSLVSVLTQIVHRGQEHVLTGPRAWGLPEVAEMLGYNVGHPVQVRRVDPEEFTAHLMDHGHELEAATEIAALLSTQVHAKATDAVSRLTGMPPRPLEGFLIDHKSAFVDQGTDPALFDADGLSELGKPVTWRS